MADSKGELANRVRCGAIFGWTKYEFDVAVRDGMPVHHRPSGRGEDYQVYTADVHRWALRKAVSEALGRENSDELDSDEELAKLRREQRITAELKNATSRGELLPAPDVKEEMQNRIGRCRALLLGLPGALCDTLAIITDPKKVRVILYDAINRALTELSRAQKEAEAEDEAA